VSSLGVVARIIRFIKPLTDNLLELGPFERTCSGQFLCILKPLPLKLYLSDLHKAILSARHKCVVEVGL